MIALLEYERLCWLPSSGLLDFLSFDEGEQVGVDLILKRRAHAVWRALVDLELRVLAAMATAASAVGIDHAQSPNVEIAAAATRQLTRNPMSRQRDVFNRSRSTVINGRRGDESAINDKTVLVGFPVITAAGHETAHGFARYLFGYAV